MIAIEQEVTQAMPASPVDEPLLDSLSSLLKDAGYSKYDSEMFNRLPGLRRLVTVEARKRWYQSDLSSHKHLALMVMGHTIEAMQPSVDTAFLSSSITSVVTRTTAKPTCDFVMPTVMDLLDMETATEYYDRMIGVPGDPFSGWLPFPSDRPTLVSWQERFRDTIMYARVQGQLDYLDMTDEAQVRQSDPIDNYLIHPSIAVRHD